MELEIRTFDRTNNRPSSSFWKHRIKVLGTTMLPNLLAVAMMVACLIYSVYAQDDRGPVCKELLIPVTISGKNINVPNEGLGFITNANILGGLVNLLFYTVVPFAGTYNISGRYCEPEVSIARRKDTLQLLVHPATYDRNYVRLTLPSLMLSLTSTVVWRWLSWLRIREREIQLGGMVIA